MSKNLARAQQFFLCLFCTPFALRKTGFFNRNLTQKGFKIELFLQKKQKLFAFFFKTPFRSHNFNTSPMPPPFKNFSLDALNSKQKPSVKNGQLGRSEIGRPAGQLALILKFNGRVGLRKF